MLVTLAAITTSAFRTQVINQTALELYHAGADVSSLCAYLSFFCH